MPTAREEPPLSFFRWEPGREPAAVSEADAASVLTADGQLLWIDLGLSTDDPTSLARRVEAIGLPGFQAPMLFPVISGMSPDDPRSAEKSGLDDEIAELLREGNTARFVSWIRFRAEGLIPRHTRPQLFAARVIVLVGDGWLITHRQSAFEVRGGGSAEGVSRAELLEAGKGPGRVDYSADDVATLIIKRLANSFPIACTTLERHFLNSDLDRWDGETDDDRYVASMEELAFRIDTLSLWLRELERPERDPEVAWFRPTVEKAGAKHIRETIGRTVRSLSDLRRDLRSAVDEYRREATRRRSDRTQLIFGLLAAAFLGPTLVAASLSAFPNWLSGREHDRLLVFVWVSAASIVITGTLVAAALRRPSLTLCLTSNQTTDRQRLWWVAGGVLLNAALIIIAVWTS